MSNYYNDNYPMPILSVSDNPMEKVGQVGADSISDVELLSVLIDGRKSRDKAKEILTRYPNIKPIASMSADEIKREFAVSTKSASRIAVAFELARRERMREFEKTPCIAKSLTIYEIMKDRLEHLPYEEFHIILLNSANRIIKTMLISKGGVTRTIADGRIIFKHAIQCLACGIIFVHNHPSGSLKPSRDDIELTHTLVQGASTLQMKVLDHVIISSDGYYSFAEDGILF